MHGLFIEQAVANSNSVQSEPNRDNPSSGSTQLPKYCATIHYQDFFAYFVRGHDDQKNEIRNTYTWDQIEIRNYDQTEQLLDVVNHQSYKAFRLGLNNSWIYIDRENPHFQDQPAIRISRRKPGDPPRVYLDLQNFKPDPFVVRLKAQKYAKLTFRDVTDRSFQVDYADAQYEGAPYAKPDVRWIQTSEISGAYVFEHRNGCWYLTQDLRVPRR